jgi:hypothetical protein
MEFFPFFKNGGRGIIFLLSRGKTERGDQREIREMPGAKPAVNGWY